MIRDVQLAASKVHEWLLASNGTTEEENVAIINKSKMISNNRLHLELGRQGKIGAIDKQVLHKRLLTINNYLSANDMMKNKCYSLRASTSSVMLIKIMN